MILVIKKTGFTLVELLVVMAILVFLSVGLLATLNPIFQVDKANDARRKKDLAKIRVAFEEYYNDKGCYPTGELLENIKSSANCGSDVFSPWLPKWPCDPTRKTVYYVFTEEAECPSWFKVITNLSNQSDKDIPGGWYTLGNYFIGDGTLSTTQVNYGTSSTNTVWYERELSANCVSDGYCYRRSGPSLCQNTYKFPDYFACEGSDCFLEHECKEECQVSCCNMGLPCD